jgi:spore germination protein GerM
MPMQKPKKPVGFIFWTLFFVVILSLFFVSAPRIRSTLENTGIMDRLSHKNETESPTAAPELPSDTAADEPASSERPLAGAGEESPSDELSPPPAITETKPAAQPVPPPTKGKSQDRAIYFIRVDGDGAILRTPVTRAIAASNSPLADALRVLLQGPTAEEQNRGLITLIPQGAQFLRAEVRGSTADISFSEEFQFNNYGVEGYVGQLRQIIWTATEFPNIADVQILIDGRIVEYLGERIKIGSPLGRNSF